MTDGTKTVPPAGSSDPALRQKGGRARRIGKRLALVATSTILGLLACELLVRIFADDILPHPSGPRYLYRADPVLGIEHRPGFHGRFQYQGEFDVPIRINSIGFRDIEIGAKNPSTKRILSLSDSFGFGYGVTAEETYARVLEQDLRSGDPPAQVEVINGAASGYATTHMLEILRRHGPALRPDIVIASFFFVNDLSGNLDELQTERGGIVLTKFFANQVDTSPFLRFSFERSYLCLLLARAWYNYKFRAAGIDAQLGEQQSLSGNWGLEYLAVQPSEHVQKQWKFFAEVLADLKTECDKLGAKLVLVNIPLEYQTRLEKWDAILAEHKDISRETHDVDYPSKRLAQVCSAVGVPLLDLLPGFRSVVPVETRYFPLNQHFNALGNRMAASLIAAFLKARGFL